MSKLPRARPERRAAKRTAPECGSRLALAALDGVGTGRSARTACANAPQPAYRHLEEVERPQAMASPSYGIDVVALASRRSE